MAHYRRVRDLRGLSMPERLVLYCLADHSDSEGRAWPSIETICEAKEIGRTSVFTAIRILKARGIIAKDWSPGVRGSVCFPPDAVRNTDDGPRNPNSEQISSPSVLASKEVEPLIEPLKKESIAGGSPPAPLPVSPKVPQQTSLLPDPPKTQPQRPKKSPPEAPTASAWAAYAEGYRKRYGADPVRNAKVNGQLSSLVKDYGGDAERLVAFYLARDGQNYTRDYHPIWALLRDAQKLHTEMRTGRAAADPPPAWRPPEKAKPYRPPYFDPVVPMKFNRLPPTPEEEAAAREALHALRERTAPTEAPPEGQP